MLVACRKFGTIDLAISEKTSADYTVFCVWAVTPDNDLLLLHVFRARVSNAEQLNELHRLHTRYQPDYWKIETVAYQAAFYQQALVAGIPSRPFKPDRDKERRATTAAVWSENGKSYWLQNASWLSDWEAELVTFPKGAHDDMVDNYSIAADDVCMPGIPLMGDEPQPEPVKEPSLTEIMQSDPFKWIETHGGACLYYNKMSVEVIQKMVQAQKDAAAQRAKDAWLAGEITMNEAREMQELPPDPGGDVYRFGNVLVRKQDLSKYAEQSLQTPAAPPAAVPENILDMTQPATQPGGAGGNNNKPPPQKPAGANEEDGSGRSNQPNANNQPGGSPASLSLWLLLLMPLLSEKRTQRPRKR